MNGENTVMIKGLIRNGEELERGYIVSDITTGLITEFEYGEKSNFNGICFEYDKGEIIEAGDFNAHSHPEQSIYTDIVDKSWDLPTWCRNTIYKYSPILTPRHIYLGCCRAFSRMLSYGVTSVMVSFYCHNNKGNEYDREVIRAARDVGIRLYFGRMNYDIINEDAYEGKKNSQIGYYEKIKDAEKFYDELVEEFDCETIEIAPAVHSIHASTKDAVINAINLGNRDNKYVQFHLSEDKGDVELSLKLYGLRPVEFLEDLLLMGEIKSLENVLLSDCVWIDDKEREIIKKYNMNVVLNPRMNDRIKTGEARLDKLIELGIYPYLGTDGEASNDDLSIRGEKEFLKNRFKNIDNSLIDKLGRKDLKYKKGNIGNIKVGNYCDIKVISKDEIKDVFVGGRKVIENGRLITMDAENCIEQKLKTLVKETF